MSEFLVPDDCRQAPTRGAPAVQVTPVPGGVRLTFAPAGSLRLANELAAVLVGVVERERRDGGGFVQVTVAEQPDGATVSLTITGPLGLGTPEIAPCHVLDRDSPHAPGGAAAADTGPATL